MTAPWRGENLLLKGFLDNAFRRVGQSGHFIWCQQSGVFHNSFLVSAPDGEEFTLNGMERFRM